MFCYLLWSKSEKHEKMHFKKPTLFSKIKNGHFKNVQFKKIYQILFLKIVTIKYYTLFYIKKTIHLGIKVKKRKNRPAKIYIIL